MCQEKKYYRVVVNLIQVDKRLFLFTISVFSQLNDRWFLPEEKRAVWFFNDEIGLLWHWSSLIWFTSLYDTSTSSKCGVHTGTCTSILAASQWQENDPFITYNQYFKEWPEYSIWNKHCHKRSYVQLLETSHTTKKSSIRHTRRPDPSNHERGKGWEPDVF